MGIAASDVEDTLDLALEKAGLDQQGSGASPTSFIYDRTCRFHFRRCSDPT